MTERGRGRVVLGAEAQRGDYEEVGKRVTRNLVAENSAVTRKAHIDNLIEQAGKPEATRTHRRLDTED